MTSRDEILSLMNRYVFSFDSGSFDQFASLFEHGQWSFEGGPPFVGKEQLRAALSNIILYADGTPRTKHLTSNIELEIHENEAKGQCYITVLQQADARPLHVIFCGHYFDEFERESGVWRFKKRHIRFGLVGDMSAHMFAPVSVPNA